ncbi:MAG TPA: hypothetical protein VF615_20475 [Longimicrobiaceae bacterium]|jgi:hypothetical protein
MSETSTWIVAASEERPLEDVAKDLAELGFEVEDVLGHVRCIVGSATREVAKAAEQVPGVLGISQDEPIRFGGSSSPPTA